MKEKVDPKLIKKYSRGEYSFRDLKKIASWFENLSYHADLKSVIESHWSDFEEYGNEDYKDLSGIFTVLKEKILAEKYQLGIKEKAFRIYTRVAAILLLPLLIYTAFSISGRFPGHSDTAQWVEVVSPKGTRTHFELPDGSNVSLNSETHLRYSSEFKKDRQVELVGEAYFDVVHNTALPFVVHTDALDVKVLGTKFNVVSMEDEQAVEIVLEEGRVQVKGNEDDFSAILKPNEGFFFDQETKTGQVQTIDAASRVAWKDGLLIFRNEPLREVLERAGRWYGVRFDIKDKAVEDFRYRATFHDEPLDEVLRLIALTAPVEYKINERQMGADGKFDEKVITITLKK